MKLRGGSLLKDINDRMVHKVACMNNPSNSSCASLNNLKYYVYSAHDITVDALLATFGDKEEVVGSGLPRYAASIVLELWNTSTGPQVKIQYHPSFNVSYFPITNLTCGCNTTTDYCKLDTFVSPSATITTWFTFTTQIMFSAIVLLFTAVNRHGH
uniref:Uncharacterized protein n=1 Tax=Plectus sambesii TaxID=2011161 RepID=A0A914WFD5_9BILA